jgi:hypothetical protein
MTESVCSFADFKVFKAAFGVPVAFSCAAPTASEDLSFAAPQPEAAESVTSRAFS